jgi:hypothetical protein
MIRISMMSALLGAASLLLAASASAFPLNAGHGALQDGVAHSLLVQAQCGPAGCPPSGSQPQRRGGPTYVPGRAGPRAHGDYYDLWGLGAGIATGIITEQMMRQRQPSGSAYAENYCGRKGLVPQFLPSGKFRCVGVGQ